VVLLSAIALHRVGYGPLLVAASASGWQQRHRYRTSVRLYGEFRATFETGAIDNPCALAACCC